MSQGERRQFQTLTFLLNANCDTTPKGTTSAKLKALSFKVSAVEGRKGSLKHFAERWIYGRGCPQLTAAVDFDRRAKGITLAIRQTAPLEYQESSSEGAMLKVLHTAVIKTRS